MVHLTWIRPTAARPWAGLLAVGLLLAALAAGCHRAGYRLCLFRRLTGLPCPTCGVTRSALHFLQGDPRAACVEHPLAAALMTGATLYALFAAASLLLVRRLPVPQAAPRVRFWTGAVLLALLLLNWAYLIARGT